MRVMLSVRYDLGSQSLRNRAERGLSTFGTKDYRTKPQNGASSNGIDPPRPLH
jgi:hypothetical protein